MTSFKQLAFILLLLFSRHKSCAESDGLLGDVTKYFGTAGKVLKFGNGICTGVKEIYNMLQPKTTQECESDQKLSCGMEQRLTDQIKHLSKKLDSLTVNMKNMKDEIVDKILNELPDQVILKNNLFEIYMRINQIENLYENFISYVKSPNDFEKDTLIDFAEHATSHDLNELPNVLKTIHWMLVQTDVNVGDSILTILSRNTQTPGQMCKRQQSLQQILYSLYNTIAIADVKGYTMIQSSYSILQLFNGGNHTGEIGLAENQFFNRISNTLKVVKKAMASASRAVWKCDTYGYDEDVTYTKLKNVFQKYMINEADINQERTCKKTCPDYQRTKVYDCYDKLICSQQRRCNGELWNCEYKISTDMWICPSEKDSSRRYDYIEYGNSQRYGLKGSCKAPSTKVSSWTRGTVSCSYCMCTCDDLGYGNSDRYINLRSVIADVYHNKVVTGVRFRKVNHIIYIQIQEGKLLPGGVIDENTLRWKPIKDYKLGEPISGTKGEKYEYIPRADLDYHVIEWKVNRGMYKDDPVLFTKAAINLDDLDYADKKSAGNSIVTGLKFSVNEVRGSGYHLNLEVWMSPFNFTTGEVDYDHSVWYSMYKEPSGRERLVQKSDKTEVKLDNLDIPINSGAPAVPTSQSNQFLYLTTSSLETDAGQNTIPFIDLQSVETYPPVPLSGLGLFHKSSEGSGGFLSLKLFTYNYEPHLKVDNN